MKYGRETLSKSAAAWVVSSSSVTRQTGLPALKSSIRCLNAR